MRVGEGENSHDAKGGEEELVHNGGLTWISSLDDLCGVADCHASLQARKQLLFADLECSPGRAGRFLPAVLKHDGRSENRYGARPVCGPATFRTVVAIVPYRQPQENPL